MLGVRAQRSAPAGLAADPELVEAVRKTMLALGGTRVHRLGVTSALRGEGRTSIALAIAMVQELDFGRHCILVDLDLESAAISRRTGVPPWPGLCELVRGEASFEDVVRPISDGISVVAAGGTGGNAPRIVSDLIRQSVLDELQRRSDVLVADLPPLVACSFGRTAATAFPDLLMVVRSQVTPVARIREAVAQLETQPQIILNGVGTRIPRWLRGLLAV